MTEKEKMLTGQLYDPSDPELDQLRLKARKLARRYNMTDEDEREKRYKILKEPDLQAPVYFDYGCNTYFGKYSGANFHFTCLDVCPVHIGDNVMIGPNVTIATPMHPMLPEERNCRLREDGSIYIVVCGVVTIGEGSVIGAGSVVTKSIPPHSLAVGNPCRVVREITEEDRMEQR